MQLVGSNTQQVGSSKYAAHLGCPAVNLLTLRRTEYNTARYCCCCCCCCCCQHCRDTTEFQLVAITPGAPVKQRIASNPLVNVNSVLFEPDEWYPQMISFNYLRNNWTVLDPKMQAVRHSDMCMMQYNACSRTALMIFAKHCLVTTTTQCHSITHHTSMMAGAVLHLPTHQTIKLDITLNCCTRLLT
jgi:hypothetical protein